MRRKVEYVENEDDRKQKPLGSYLDDPRYGLEAVQRAIDATTSDYGLLHGNHVEHARCGRGASEKEKPWTESL
jgi:hypothetical protein